MSTGVIITIIICLTVAFIFTVSCITECIDRNNYYKWQCFNPEAYEEEDEEC